MLFVLGTVSYYQSVILQSLQTDNCLIKVKVVDCVFFGYTHAFQGNVRFMKLLLSRHADWRLKDLEEMTPLHLATRHSSSKPLSLLLKHMAPGEVDTQDRNKVPNSNTHTTHAHTLGSSSIDGLGRDRGEREVRWCVCVCVRVCLWLYICHKAAGGLCTL